MSSIFSRLKYTLTACLAASLAFGLSDAPARDGNPSPVALVTDLSGAAETQVDGKKAHVTTLFELSEGARVKLFPGARMVVLYYLSARQYVLTGPALVRVGEIGVEALSGNEPISVKAPAGKDGKPLIIRPIGVTQAGVVFRGTKPIPLISPVGRKTLAARPTFRWVAVEPTLSYHFSLKDEDSNPLVTQDVRDITFELPSNIVLSEGQYYRWSVSAESSSGVSYLTNHRFAVADIGTRSQVENFRPSLDSGHGEWVTFAIWLEQEGLAEEAREVWTRLSKQGVSLPPQKLGDLK